MSACHQCYLRKQHCSTNGKLRAKRGKKAKVEDDMLGAELIMLGGTETAATAAAPVKSEETAVPIPSPHELDFSSPRIQTGTPYI